MVQVTPLSGIETGPKASPRTEIDLTSTRLLKIRFIRRKTDANQNMRVRAHERLYLQAIGNCSRIFLIIVEVRQKVKKFYYPLFYPSFHPPIAPPFCK